MIRSIFIFVTLSFASTFVYAQLWKTYSDSAFHLRAQNNDTLALVFYKKAYDLLRPDSTGTDIFIETCKKVGDIYYSKSDYDHAETFYLEGRSSFEKKYGKIKGYALKTDSLGVLNILKNNYVRSESYFLEAKEVKAKLFTNTSAEYAVSCNNLGNLYNEIGRYREAEAFLLEAKDIRGKLFTMESLPFAQSCNNLAAFYWSRAKYEKALPLAIDARRLRFKLLKQPHPDYAISCTNLANIYRDMGQYPKAEELYIEAKNVREKVFTKDHAIYAASCNILADLYEYMERYKDAEALYLEAKDIREKIFTKNSSSYAQTCNNLSGLYREMGQYKKAESLALEAKTIWDVVLPPDHPSHAININNLAQVYYAMKEFKKAERYFLDARKLWKQQLGQQHPYYTQSSINLAKVYWNLNETLKANQLYKSAFYAQYDQIDKVFQYTSEKEKQLFLKNALGSSDEYQSFCYQKLDHKKAGLAFNLSLFNRNMILSSTQQIKQSIYASGDTGLTNKYNKWIETKEKLATFYSRENSGKSTEIKQAEEASDDLEKDLSRYSDAFKDLHQKTNWQGIQKALGKTEAAIEFITYQYYDKTRWTDSFYYGALILRKGSPEPVFIRIFEKAQLDSLLTSTGNKKLNDGVNALYASRGVGVSENIASGRSLYQLIWKPIEHELEGVTTIYFAPAGNLHRIAFAALNINNKKVLSDEYKLVQLNTTASIVRSQAQFISSKDTVRLYGGIVYDEDAEREINSTFRPDTITQRSTDLAGGILRGGAFNFLEGTREEVMKLKQLAENAALPAVVLTGTSATEESLKKLSGNTSPGILHIATHGFFFPDTDYTKSDSLNNPGENNGRNFRRSRDPLFRSGLLLSGANSAWQGKYYEGIEDGILTAYEVSNMYLPHTKLVVLSACETGLGDIGGSEGVYGLQRGFKIAGAKSLVMSLWKVPDIETSEFMQLFYRDMFNKLSISDAFYDAQARMKKKYWDMPYKWAAWILLR